MLVLNPYTLISFLIWGAFVVYDFKLVYGIFEYQKSINNNIIESRIIDYNEKYLQALQILKKAYQSYIPNTYYKNILSSNLQFNPELNVFDTNKLEKLNFGSLTYQGKNLNSKKLEMMERALSLSPFYQEIKELFPRSPWVYFTAEDFIYIYPFINSKSYSFRKDTPNMQFFKLSRPEYNPSRTAYWTDPYIDEAGEGLMTTISLPIYIENIFHGAVSIDYKLTELKSVLRNIVFDSGEYLLVNQKGYLLTSSNSALINNKVLTPICTEAELNSPYNKSFSFIKNNYIYFAYHTDIVNTFIVYRISILNYYWNLISQLKLSFYITILLIIINLALYYYINFQNKLNADDIQKNKLMSLAEMSAGIAHEINNPLTVIRGRTEQLVRAIQSGEADKSYLLTSLDRISNSSDRISKIVKALKNFSREGRSDPFVKTGLRNLIDDSLILCENRIRNNDANLSVGEVPEIQINCRPYQIVQVLINIINNSYDAIEKNNEKWIKLIFTHYSNKVLIRIVDSGHGIKSEVVKKMFDPFFTSKELNKGTGLGLSISKRIVLDHGGNLYYENHEGHTCFTIELPIDKN